MRSHAKAIVAVSALLLTLALGVTLAGAVAPVVTINPASSVSYTSAHVSGTVDPQDQETYFYFQYSKDPVNEGWSSGPFQGPIAAGAGIQNVSEDLSGLTPGAEYEVRLVAENFADPAQTISAEPNPSFTTDPVVSPTVSIDPVTTFTGATATFTGSINPNAPEAAPTSPQVEAGFKVNWHFECTPACPGLQGGEVDADNTGHVVGADATGLEPNTDYEVTLVASNAGGQVTDGPQGFTTEGVAPLVQTLYAGKLGLDNATLAATINPQNSSTTYQFEWGADQSYGNVVPASATSLGASDNSFHFVSAPIGGLAAGTTYHFRVVATNTETSQSAEGSDHAFTTLTPAGPPASCSNASIRSQQSATTLPQCRAYEMVSPVEKNGGDISNNSNGSGISTAAVSQVAPSGNAVAFNSKVLFDGEGGALFGQYLGFRSQDGWATKGITPLQTPQPFPGTTSLYQWFSSDLSKAAVGTWASLAPGATAPYEVYVRDNLAGTYQLLTAPSIPVPPVSPIVFKHGVVTGASRDLSHVVFEDSRALTADAPADGTDKVYVWHNGVVSLVANDAGTGLRRAGIAVAFAGQHAVSDDGTRIFFGRNTGNRLFVWSNGIAVPVSESEASSPSGNSGVFQDATPGGEVAFFVSGDPLTDDSTASQDSYDLYRWDANAPEGEQLEDLTTSNPSGGGLGFGLAMGGGVENQGGVVGANDDGSKVYFVSSAALTEGANKGGRNLYLWQEGAGLRLVAQLSSLDTAVWGHARHNGTAETPPDRYQDARITPDGTHLLFASKARLTGYDTDGHRQLYLYNASDQSLECVSCNPRSGKSIGNASLLSFDEGKFFRGENMPNNSLPRNLTEDGAHVFFDSPEALVPGDTNGKLDVYEWSSGRPHLISSGESSARSTFVDASLAGGDAFFTTSEQLIPADIDDLVDLYDARSGGGFPGSPPGPPACEGDACQSPPQAPIDSTPSSSSYSGPGNQAVARKHRAKKHRAKKHQRKKHKRQQARHRTGSHG